MWSIKAPYRVENIMSGAGDFAAKTKKDGKK
jgi:hypothetical protein